MKQLARLVLVASAITISACSSASPTAPRSQDIQLKRVDARAAVGQESCGTGWIVASGDPCEAP